MLGMEQGENRLIGTNLCRMTLVDDALNFNVLLFGFIENFPDTPPETPKNGF